MDIVDLYAERLAERLRHVDVESPEFRRLLVQRAERQIVAGQADAQAAALDDLVEPGGLLGMSRSRHQQKGDGERPQNSNHLFLPEAEPATP
jgi:hypothetical protein